MAAPLDRASPGPRASVVICCYDQARLGDVVAAVRSLEARCGPPEEVVVVVDHNPGLLRALSALLPGTRTVANAGPRGLSGARNHGIAVTRGELVVFLDDDARAGPDMVARMERAMAGDRVLGVGARVMPAWDSPEPRWFPGEFLWVVGCTYRGLDEGPVRNPIGAAMAVRRSVFEAVGGFATSLGRTHSGLPLGCEETEIAIRASRAFPGWTFVQSGDATCEHRVPAARATWSYLVRRCWAEGISKASLSRIAGREGALAAERAYVRSVLPRGVARGAGDLARGDVGGGLRAAAILIGLAVTAAGYAAGLARSPRGPAGEPAQAGEAA